MSKATHSNPMEQRSWAERQAQPGPAMQGLIDTFGVEAAREIKLAQDRVLQLEMGAAVLRRQIDELSAFKRVVHAALDRLAVHKIDQLEAALEAMYGWDRPE